MTDKHEVTVYDRAPATAHISVAQVEAYLRRTGWLIELAAAALTRWSTETNYLSVMRSGSRLDHVVDVLAEHERRQPSAVLADIAKEQP